MANLTTAPASQVAKAIAARTALKTVLKEYGVEYCKAYSSHRVQEKQVRIKLWSVMGLNAIKGKAAFYKKVEDLGFEVVVDTGPWLSRGATNIVGYF